jgi:hypothetical protein
MRTKLSLNECDSLVKELCIEAEVLCESHCRGQEGRVFDRFVPANYPLVYSELRKLAGAAVTFLELGSGLGVVTIMADLLGFEAYGIEIRADLVGHAEQLAETFKSKAVFATGSFLPENYEWSAEFFCEDLRTDPDGMPAYDELDMDLQSFDLIYAFPGPDERLFFRDLLRQSGRHGSIFLTDNGIEGIELWTVSSDIE